MLGQWKSGSDMDIDSNHTELIHVPLHLQELKMIPECSPQGTARSQLSSARFKRSSFRFCAVVMFLIARSKRLLSSIMAIETKQQLKTLWRETLSKVETMHCAT